MMQHPTKRKNFPPGAFVTKPAKADMRNLGSRSLETSKPMARTKDARLGPDPLPVGLGGVRKRFRGSAPDPTPTERGVTRDHFGHRIFPLAHQRQRSGWLTLSPFDRAQGLLHLAQR